MSAFNALKRAAIVIAMAALACLPAAWAQKFDHVSALTGYWGWVSGDEDPADFSGTCDNHPMRVWFTENGGRYHSQWELDIEAGYVSTSPVYQSTLGSSGLGVLYIAYDQEERMDAAGNAVSWYLVMVDDSRFVWVRNDWVGTGDSTRPMVRCAGRMVS